MVICNELLLSLKSFLGNAPKTLYALLILVALDYVTGICVAIREKKISSKVGAKGIASKVMIFAMVSLSAIIDRFLIGNGSALCALTILFYCANEIFSILENANKFGLPLPKQLTKFLEEFKDRIH